MTTDLDVLLQEVDDVKQLIKSQMGGNVDSNAIFESLEQNGFRENRVEFVAKQLIGEDDLLKFPRPMHDNAVECVAIVNRGEETIDLTVDIAEKKTPSLAASDVINIDSESYSSDSSVELLANQTTKMKRKCKTTAERDKRKKQKYKKSLDCSIQEISESLKNANTSNTNHITDDLCDVNNNDPNNNTEPEPLCQQPGGPSAPQGRGESELFYLPSTSKTNINIPSCGFPPSLVTDSNLENLLTDDEDDVPQLNDEDLLHLNQERVRESLLREARFIHKLVPHQHLDEIFSYLEANLDCKDRMNVVLLDFLQRDKQRNDIDDQKELPSIPLTSAFSEKTDEEPVPKPDSTTNAYSAEVEVYSISDDDDEPAINTKMNTIMNTESVTSTDDISVIDIDYALETQIANGINTSPLLDLTEKKIGENEENEVVEKYLTTLTEMFPNVPKQQLEQHCKNIDLEDVSLEDLILKLLETDSEVKKVSPEENLARYLPEKQPTAGNSSAVRDNSYPSECIVDSTSCKEQEEEEEVEELRYKTLLAIFPDADPDFLREKAATLPQDDESFRNFITINLEQKGYPSLKDYEQRQEIAAVKKKYSEDFSIQGFLDAFPDPLNYFKGRKNVHDRNIKYHAFNYLKNKFRWLRVETLRVVYEKHENNLTKAFEELETLQNSHNKKKKEKSCFRLSQRLVADHPKIDKLDEPFLQEIAFLDHKDEINAFLTEKEERRQKAFEEAKKNGSLLECACCYDSEVLSEDIRSCEEGHLFCKECVKRSAEIAIGEGKTSFPCLATCNSEFSPKVLQTVLRPDICSKMLKRKQLEEVKQAGIEGLETCPFCDFASIPEEANKVFQCLNPECMKETCRACRQPSHIPLRCEEIEKPEEVKMRIYIEDKMTQALVRECWRCRQKFVKEDGCNKMQCPCGAMMCYICRKPVKDYKHFNGQGGTEYHKCPLYSNNDELHIAAVEQEGLKAKREVKQQNPDFKLKHDPTKNIPKTKYRHSRRRNNLAYRDFWFYHRGGMLFNYYGGMNPRRVRNERVHVRPNAVPMYVRRRIVFEEPNGLENMYVEPGEDLESIHRAVINLTRNMTPALPRVRVVDRALVHDVNPTFRIHDPPVQRAAHDARANEIQPLPQNMTPLFLRVDELNPPKTQRTHPNAQVCRESLNLSVFVGDTDQYGTAKHLQARPVRQAGYGLQRPVKPHVPAVLNVQTPGCSLQNSVKKHMPVRRNMRTLANNMPGQVKQPMPVHQSTQTPGSILPSSVRQPMPAQQNVQTPEHSQPDASAQNVHLWPNDTVRQADHGRQDVPDMENVVFDPKKMA